MTTKITSASLRRLFSPALFGALALSCGTLSIAADPGDAYQAVVKFGDLNLSNPQGATVLYSRIVAAAREVCNPFNYEGHYLGAQASVEACVRKAVRKAVTEVGQSELLAVYSEKNREALPITIAAAQTR